MWLKLVNSFSILWCQALFGLNVLHLSKVNFLVPRMYFVKLHGTHFNYVWACISDMLMYSNTGFARYHICHELLHIAFFLAFFLVCCFSLYLYVCMYCIATTSWWNKIYIYSKVKQKSSKVKLSQAKVKQSKVKSSKSQVKYRKVKEKVKQTKLKSSKSHVK